MKITPVLVLIVLFSGCSSNEKGASDNVSGNNESIESNSKSSVSSPNTVKGKGQANKGKGHSKPNSRTPDNLIAIEELFDKYNDDNAEVYQELVGTKVSISGYVNVVQRSSQDGDLAFSIRSKQSLLDSRLVECYFKSTAVLNKCLPGQKIVVEGVVSDKESAFLAGIADCKILSVEGDHTVKVLSSADIEQGAEFDLLQNQEGIVTGTVLSTHVSKNDENSYFIDLKAKEAICVHFNLRNHPDASKIKSLRAGDSIRVFGSVLKSSSRQDYKGEILLFSCELLE